MRSRRRETPGWRRHRPRGRRRRRRTARGRQKTDHATSEDRLGADVRRMLQCARVVYLTMENSRAHNNAGDARLAALSAWLSGVLPAPATALAPASEDASFRRYFRVTLTESVTVPGRQDRAMTLIAMDAPPPQENCSP